MLCPVQLKLFLYSILFAANLLIKLCKHFGEITSGAGMRSHQEALFLYLEKALRNPEEWKRNEIRQQ